MAARARRQNRRSPRRFLLNTIRHALRMLDVEPPRDDELLWCVGPPLREIFARLLPSGETATIERAVSAYVDRYDSIEHRENRVYAGVPAIGLKTGGIKRYQPTSASAAAWRGFMTYTFS
jgi:phosphoglycolate phosphatase